MEYTEIALMLTVSVSASFALGFWVRSWRERKFKGDLHFITQWGLDFRRADRPELISFRLWSKRQPRSNPQKWWLSVEEMLEKKQHESPHYLLQNHHAESLAQSLLKVAAESRQAYDDL